MDNQGKVMELQKLMHEKQNRFVYYISGLCVAAIAFSVNQTTDDKLNCSHIILGLALICWGASIFCSFQYIQIKLNALHENARVLTEIERTENENKNFATNVGNEHLEKFISRKSDRMHSNFMWVQYWFYAGMILFLGWHIIQMSKN